MAELIFTLTVIFVAYVVFKVTDDKKTSPEAEHVPEAKQVDAEPEESRPVIAETSSQAVEPQPIPAPVAEKRAVKPARAKAAGSKAAAVKTEPVKEPETKQEVSKAPTVGDTLKNPKTGEVAKMPGNYNFAKRWIKDALVEEGLLEKVYKNTELDEATNAKIQAALLQLKALDKYKE
jgi:hypothetical protein